MEIIWQFLKKLNIWLIYDQAISLLNIEIQENWKRKGCLPIHSS